MALTGVWPDPALGWPTQVVLVARSDMTGLGAVGAFLQDWATGTVPDLHLAGVVISADAPVRPPRRVRARLEELQSLVRLWHLEWVPQWREEPYTSQPAVKRLLAAVNTTLLTQERS